MKISVVIATRNRRDDVCETITNFLKQTHNDFEIIVVDNNSNDGTKEKIGADFPQIQYIYLPNNIDILAQNLGIEHATGEIIWRTDSDSYPADISTFAKVVDIFENNSDVDIIATEEVYPKANYLVRDYYPFPVDKVNVPSNGYKSYILTGPGSAIRKNVFDTIGGFWEFGHEELDFSTRAILAGFNIRYFPNIVTYHFSSQGDRNKVERWQKISSQLIRYNWKYFPLHLAIGRTFIILFSQFILGLKATLNPIHFITWKYKMIKTIYITIKNERIHLTKAQIKEITMGVSIAKNEYKMFLNLIKSKTNKIISKSK